MRRFLATPRIRDVVNGGAHKATVAIRGGPNVDLMIMPPGEAGTYLVHFTGSKEHNVRLRARARDQGWSLSEKGFLRIDPDSGRALEGEAAELRTMATEAEVYAFLGLPYIEPELREDQGEIAAAREGRLPRLLEPGELRGDLQTQTDWTDGADSIADMARAAQDAGLEYIAVTDHTVSLAMVRGSDEAKLRRQMREIEHLNRSLTGFRILTGAEVNIDREGNLDIDNETLAALDVVGIAVHSHFSLPRAAMTARIVRAMRNPHADILFHPTGRRIGKREAYDVDMDAVIAAARSRRRSLVSISAPLLLQPHKRHPPRRWTRTPWRSWKGQSPKSQC
jgi:DNA polymerase (family 10)